LPFLSNQLSGSPSVRCASTTVPGLNWSLPVTRVIVGGPTSPPGNEPGTSSGGPFETAYEPVYSYGAVTTPPWNGQTWTWYVPGTMFGVA
jgi:hypothetical protein